MLSFIFQTIILSLIFIWLIHHLFNYLKDTLTVPKIKDLVNEPNKKYKEMYEIINQHQHQHQNNDIDHNLDLDHNTQINTIYNTNLTSLHNSSSNSNTKSIQDLGYTIEDLLPKDMTVLSSVPTIMEEIPPLSVTSSSNTNVDMKNELKNFLKKQMNQ